jgi:hypothetical protein
MPEPSITTARELWPALIERAGLTGKLDTRQSSYDANLIAKLRCKPLPASSAPLERLIASQDVPVSAVARRIGFPIRWDRRRRHDNPARHEEVA